MSSNLKRAVIQRYLIGDPDIADNTLAQALGVSNHTILKVRHRLETARQIKKVQKTKGKDGKVRPVQYAKRIITNTPKEFEQAQQLVKDLPDKCAGKTLDIASARKLSAKNRNKVEREGRIIEPLPHDAVRLPPSKIIRKHMIALAGSSRIAPSGRSSTGVNVVLHSRH